jgi:YD repeat-containing protein
MVVAVARSLVRLVPFVLALAPSALAQTGVAPTMADDALPLAQMPALNGFPSKHDEPGATDNEASECHMSGGAPEQDLWSEIGDEQDSGDPVALHNGMVTFRATDLVVPGRGVDYELTRRYSSKRSDVDGPVGFGWAHNYDVWLQLQGSACSGLPLTVILWNGNNRADVYRLNETTCEYTSPRGIFTKLIFDAGANRYTLRARHGTKTVFDVVTVGSITYGRLASITDRNGNALAFTYTANTVPGGRSRLRKVIDTMGREITYSYTSAGRVSKVTDFTNREVNYAYDSSGNLISARGPAVLFACAEHLAPLGRIERYRYYGGTSALAHRLTEIVRPNQGQSNVNGQAAVKFEYHADSNNWAYGWCTKQTLGNPAAGIGGEIDYQYHGYSFQPLSQPSVERIKTTVTDRRGYTTEYLFNENGHCVKVTEYSDLGMQDSHVTTITYDDAAGFSEGLVKKIVYPRGNEKQYTYVAAPNNRWEHGNLLTVKWLPGSIASDQAERVISYAWEPVFQHIRSVTDERGFQRTFFCDWMEGSASDPNPNVIDLAAAELGVGYATAQSLIGSYLTGTDLNGDGRQTVLKGNQVQRREPNVNLAPAQLGSGPQAAQEGDATQQAVTTTTYNAYGQATSTSDAEENVTVYLYNPESDPDGDGTTNGGDDTVTGGYVRRVVEDTSLPFSDPQIAGVGDRSESTDIGRNSNFTPAAAPTNRTTDFLYTKFGYQKAVIDARGVKHDSRRNDLGEIYAIVRAASVADVASRMGGCDPNTPEDLTGQAYSYVELFCHDFNGNVAERRLQNSGNDPDAGLVSGWLESDYEYDRNDNLKSESHEYGQSGEMATTSYLYDENDNLIEITEPEGNKTRFEYDGHDHLWKRTRGFGTADASTDERLYDDNGNLVTFKDGSLHATTYTYDGFDRVKTRTEPIGTVTTWTYDAASNVTHVEIEGMTGGPSQVPPPVFTTLAETETFFDERSRPYQPVEKGAPRAVC